MSKISILMYHYVRDLKHSRYPAIKGLDATLFREQMEYLLQYYRVIRMEELIAALRDKKRLPSNSVLLTFDDGYKDHFEFVFPILDELGIQGSFFPPAKAILQNEVLDVNKIHFLLATVPDKFKLVDAIYGRLDRYREEYDLKPNEFYWSRHALETRFDAKETVFVKKMLQRELPLALRKKIVDEFFREYVSNDEAAFSRELYLGTDQIKCMSRNGMFFGSHGYEHFWLNNLPAEQQENEIRLSLDFLSSLGCNTKEWVMCYPYGAYNASLLSILRNYGCCLALTTQVGIADLEADPLTMPRLDTNDLPKAGRGLPNEWTLNAFRSFLDQVSIEVMPVMI